MSKCILISIATRSGHLDYPGHLGHFLSGSKWVSPIDTYVPDPDKTIWLSCALKNGTILSNRAVTNI